MNRTEGDVSSAFVALAGGLTNGEDPVDVLTTLTSDCARLLDVASAGLLLADRHGVLHVMAASSDRTRELEVFQVQRADGPCGDSYRSAKPVSVPDLNAVTDRWPHFVPAARQAGYASVHALPMRLRDLTLGALGLFGTTAGALSEADLSLGQALADVAAIALVQDRAIVDREAVNVQLQMALTGRVVLEQAKGLLAQKGDLDMAGAFQALRCYSRDRNERLTDVARALVSRTLLAQQVLDHVQQASRTRRTSS